MDFVLKKCSEKINALKLGGKHFSFQRKLETGKFVHLSKLMYEIECLGQKARSRHYKQPTINWQYGYVAKEVTGG